MKTLCSLKKTLLKMWKKNFPHLLTVLFKSLKSKNEQACYFPNSKTQMSYKIILKSFYLKRAKYIFTTYSKWLILTTRFFWKVKNYYPLSRFPKYFPWNKLKRRDCQRNNKLLATPNRKSSSITGFNKILRTAFIVLFIL